MLLIHEIVLAGGDSADSLVVFESSNIFSQLRLRFFYFSILLVITGWTNVNLLYLSDSIEVASLERLTLWCPETNQSKRPLAW